MEDLAYRRLLDFYYLHQQPIQQRDIARQIGMREYEQDVLAVLNEFFLSTEDGFINARADKEISNLKAMSEGGKRGAAKRWGKGGDSPPIATPMPSPMLTINHKPITNNQENTVICPPNGELAQCDHKSVISLYHEHLPTLRRIEVWNDTRAGYLRQRWREVASELPPDKRADQQAVLGWWRDFFQYVGKSRFLTGKTNDKSGRAFTADLEWILRPSNFAKIVEGKYHGS